MNRDGVGAVNAFQQAVSLHAQGRLWEAGQLYEVVLKSDDRHFDAVYRLGLIRLQSGNFTDAAALFRRATKLDKGLIGAEMPDGAAL